MRRGRRLLVATVLLSIVGVAAICLFAYTQFTGPGPLVGPVTVVVQRGASVGAIAEQLQRHSVVASSLAFRLAAKLSGAEGGLRAGEYEFLPQEPLRQVLLDLREGRVVVRKVTVPEGWTSHQVLALLNAAPGLEGPLPDTLAEGKVLPQTYTYTWGDARAEILARMEAQMDETVSSLWESRVPDLPLASPEEAIILASVVERETSLPEERPRVAAVFLNRLRAGMRLQADPTVAYAIWGGPGTRPLTLTDLQYPSAYNTYVCVGLPPGPIANPGLASLEAVLHPAQTNELYFVADGTGGHAFARTLAEHQQNVLHWRRLNDADPSP